VTGLLSSLLLLASASASDRSECKVARSFAAVDPWLVYVLDHPGGRCTTEAFDALVRLGLDPQGLGRALTDLQSSDAPRQVAARQWLVAARAPAPASEVYVPAAFGVNPRPRPPSTSELADPAHAERSASGLAWQVLSGGAEGPNPGPTSTVVVHYAGYTTDGVCFDDSWARGTPLTFPVNGVIPGFSEALQGMVAGEVRRVWIPASLAYGERPRPGIPAGPLTFDVALLAIDP
jgi:hypothetical protein